MGDRHFCLLKELADILGKPQAIIFRRPQLPLALVRENLEPTYVKGKDYTQVRADWSIHIIIWKDVVHIDFSRALILFHMTFSLIKNSIMIMITLLWVETGNKVLGDLESNLVIIQYSNSWRRSLITFNTLVNLHYKDLAVLSSKISERIKSFTVQHSGKYQCNFK